MQEKNKILENFGRILIKDCFDPTFKNAESLRFKEDLPLIFKQDSAFLKNLSKEDFESLKKYYRYSLGSLLFNVLRLFEENPDFKIIFDNGKDIVDLSELSEDFKSEPIIENGWIDRFSETERR